MLFRTADEVLDTSTMLCLDVEGIYFTIYLDPAHQKAYYQTFDDDQGVVISPAPADQAQALLVRFSDRNPSDISPHRDWLRAFNPAVVPQRRRGAAYDRQSRP